MLTQSLLQHLPDPVCPDASFPTPRTATPLLDVWHRPFPSDLVLLVIVVTLAHAACLIRDLSPVASELDERASPYSQMEISADPALFMVSLPFNEFDNVHMTSIRFDQ
jgi:hypothetical protein